MTYCLVRLGWDYIIVPKNNIPKGSSVISEGSYSDLVDELREMRN